MSLKITLHVTKLNADRENIREITFDVTGMAIEDWFERNSTQKVPNACKIFANGDCYRANISRSDLEKTLEESGVKILKPKK